MCLVLLVLLQIVIRCGQSTLHSSSHLVFRAMQTFLLFLCKLKLCKADSMANAEKYNYSVTSLFLIFYKDSIYLFEVERE